MSSQVEVHAHPKDYKVKELVTLIRKNEVLAVANLNKVRSSQLQQIRRILRPSVKMKVAKNNIIKKALVESGKANVEDVSQRLSSSSVLLFTDMNPFSLNLTLGRNKVDATAKAGDIAPDDVVIKQGSTGLPPGPAISELNEIGVRTRIESGTIWTVRDTVVAKKGDQIQPNLAGILSRLGIKPLKVGLELNFIYQEGSVLEGRELQLDLDDYREKLGQAASVAFDFAVKAEYPVKETMPTILRQAFASARNMAVKAAIPEVEVIGAILQRGRLDMLSLSFALRKKDERAAPAA